MGYISIVTIGILVSVLITLPFKAFTQALRPGERLPTNHKHPLFVQNGGKMQNYFENSRGLPYLPGGKTFILILESNYAILTQVILKGNTSILNISCILWI